MLESNLHTKKVLVLLFADYRSTKFKNNFYYWQTANDLREDIVHPMEQLFGEVQFMNYFQLFGDNGFAFLNSYLLRKVKEFKPDYLFWCPLCYEIFPSTLRHIRGMGTIVIALSFDDVLRAENYVMNWIYDVDVLVYNDPHFIDFYKSKTINSICAFLPSASTQWYYKITNCTKQHDVTFVGSASPYRREIVRWLIQNNINVVTFGIGWDNPYLTREEKVKVYNESKINLSLEAYPRNSQVLDAVGLRCTTRSGQVKGRILELGISGNFFISEEVEGLDALTQNRVRLVSFNNKEELLERIFYYLAHANEREEYEERIYNFFREQYDSINVVRKVFGAVNSSTVQHKGYKLKDLLTSRKGYFKYAKRVCKKRVKAIGEIGKDRGLLREAVSHAWILAKDLVFMFNPRNYV